MDDLRETAVYTRLTTQWIGQTYRYFPSIGSTNDQLKKEVGGGGRGRNSPPAGTVYLADFQRRGRGRLSRRWLAPAGSSLLLSTLFRPDWPGEQANWMTMLTSLAAAEAVEAVADLPVGVKWPNDLMLEIDGVWHKFGGLLLEGNMGENGRLLSAVVGIGINVNIPPSQLPEAPITPATSLMAVLGMPIPRLSLLIGFLSRLETWYERVADGQSPQPAWTQRLVTLGQQVRVTQPGAARSITGLVEGTDVWGQLLLRDEEGQLHTIAAGDVTLR